MGCSSGLGAGWGLGEGGGSVVGSLGRVRDGGMGMGGMELAGRGVFLEAGQHALERHLRAVGTRQFAT